MVSLLPLTLERAEARRGGKRICGPVDLRLEAGGLTAVIGPNGSGKTTLLRMMHGLQRHRGRVAWNAPLEQAHRGQAFVFQTPVMLRRSVGDNLAFPLRLAGMSRRDARASASAMAARLGLSDMLPRSALRLSLGERQKLALGRALIREPEVLFLDEPCASLDGAATREIEAILHAAQEAGTTVVMATHDLAQARRLARDVIFLLNGRIAEHAPASAFFAGPEHPSAAAFLRGDIVE